MNTKDKEKIKKEIAENKVNYDKYELTYGEYRKKRDFLLGKLEGYEQAEQFFKEMIEEEIKTWENCQNRDELVNMFIEDLKEILSKLNKTRGEK